MKINYIMFKGVENRRISIHNSKQLLTKGFFTNIKQNTSTIKYHPLTVLLFMKFDAKVAYIMIQNYPRAVTQLAFSKDVPNDICPNINVYYHVIANYLTIYSDGHDRFDARSYIFTGFRSLVSLVTYGPRLHTIS